MAQTASAHLVSSCRPGKAASTSSKAMPMAFFNRILLPQSLLLLACILQYRLQLVSSCRPGKAASTSSKAMPMAFFNRILLPQSLLLLACILQYRLQLLSGM
eukprot:TRINITY_DN8680_c0_g1_i2.p2 TRINITY_DN8680_c0_g1~~TRINITY_DN8680_c0_g1_i2.p2  ORF type:complete len:102 (-),score=17.39 TRINITY_DN8680_c0_g1_i2:307-612(-)